MPRVERLPSRELWGWFVALHARLGFIWFSSPRYTSFAKMFTSVTSRPGHELDLAIDVFPCRLGEMDDGCSAVDDEFDVDGRLNIGQPLPFTTWPALVPPIVSRIVPWPDVRRSPSRALRVSPRCDTRDLGNDEISDRGRSALGDQLAFCRRDRDLFRRPVSA